MTVKRKFNGDLYIKFVVDEDKISTGDDMYELTVNILDNLFNGNVDILFEDEQFNYYQNEDNRCEGVFENITFNVPAKVRTRDLLTTSIKHNHMKHEVVLENTVTVKF